MKKTKILMDMPITVEICDEQRSSDVETPRTIERVFEYLQYVDDNFSYFKKESEVSRINKGIIKEREYSQDMAEILFLSEKTKRETFGYFDIINQIGLLDPSGLVKGWAIRKSMDIIGHSGFSDYFIEASGDIEARGNNPSGHPWMVGIRNPFFPDQIVKTIILKDCAIATSGTYFRGQHIYNPKERTSGILDIVSLSVIGPNILDADRFATAAFAMGQNGIDFIENLNGFEGYMIGANGLSTMTSGFKKYLPS